MIESKFLCKKNDTSDLKEQFSSMLLELEENRIKKQQFFSKSFAENQSVYADFNVTKYVVFLKEGLCAVSETDLSKKRIVIEILGDQEFLGLGRLFGASVSDDYQVMTKAKSEVIFIEKEYFLNYLSIRPSFSELLIQYVSQKICNLHSRVLSLTHYTRKKKVLHSLYNLSDSLSFRVGEYALLPYEVTTKLLAEYSGVDLYFFNLVVNELMDIQVLKYTSNGELAINIRKLEELFDEND
ncbi:Crp/Fnr family transcriptional regulator [Listeria sp. PSOL-1]|uniref:Crp/Fnr family transcriptional regulator n=1 Tax=Listeria sp. PSOL-1 TaxID=1844999 RepID=UPI0013D2E5C2|nr:Crp/Fnr family transcriptional regulator [Listeria sp. PSOL-1]